MSKRSIYTTITPLSPGITRATVLETLHTHTEMIDLNPLVIERHPIKPPPEATAEEFHCQWYELTDKIQYLPGGIYSGKVTYTACFHDLANGVQTHVYAPMGLDIRGHWSIGGSLPGEPQPPVEMGKGIPLHGLYLREDTDVKCNIFLMNFVKKNLKNSHAALVARMVVKAQLYEAAMNNDRMSEMTHHSRSSSPHHSRSSSPHLSYIQHVPSLHQRSPLASPSFPPPAAQNPMYAPASMQPYQQPFDPRFSQGAPPLGFVGSPGYQMDPAYANANPYLQHQGQYMYAQHQHGGSMPSFHHELASNTSASETASQMGDAKGKEKEKDAKGGMGPHGPPTHPVQGFAPVELPAEVQK
jgi:hypothetical protein